jgi:hypothetical protein
MHQARASGSVVMGHGTKTGGGAEADAGLKTVAIGLPHQVGLCHLMLGPARGGLGGRRRCRRVAVGRRATAGQSA